MKRRAYIPLKTKLCSALCQMLRPDETGALVKIIPHDQAKAMTEDQILSVFDWQHYPIPKANDGPDTHWNLEPMVRADHRAVTAKVDIPRIAKGKRIRRANEEAVRRLLAKDRGEEKPPSRWPKRKLRSRGFEARTQ